MRLLRLAAIMVLLLACVVLGSACAGAKGEQGLKGDTGATGQQGVQGVKGDTGDQGPQGIQGVQGIQGLQGIQGNPGTPGIGVEWVGQWDSGTLYAKYDGVGYQGSSYISRQNNNTNHLPTDTNWWDLWVEKGDTGVQGIQGIQGVQGAPGPNMIVAMGVIGANGYVYEGYNVTSCVWNDTVKGYLIDLTGITFDLYEYVVLAMPLGYGGATPDTTSYGGLLEVDFWYEGSQSYNQASFYFVVLDPDLA